MKEKWHHPSNCNTELQEKQQTVLQNEVFTVEFNIAGVTLGQTPLFQVFVLCM